MTFCLIILYWLYHRYMMAPRTKMWLVIYKSQTLSYDHNNTILKIYWENREISNLFSIPATHQELGLQGFTSVFHGMDILVKRKIGDSRVFSWQRATVKARGRHAHLWAFFLHFSLTMELQWERKCYKVAVNQAAKNEECHTGWEA